MKLQSFKKEPIFDMRSRSETLQSLLTDGSRNRMCKSIGDPSYGRSQTTRVPIY